MSKCKTLQHTEWECTYHSRGQEDADGDVIGDVCDKTVPEPVATWPAIAVLVLLRRRRALAEEWSRRLDADWRMANSSIASCGNRAGLAIGRG